MNEHKKIMEKLDGLYLEDDHIKYLIKENVKKKTDYEEIQKISRNLGIDIKEIERMI